MKGLTTLSAALSLLASPASGADCGMARAFDQPDERGRATVAVWKDGPGSALLFADGLNVNTDGTRRSYSVDDFWGESRALNNLCNAMSDACDGLDNDGLRARRILTQQAKAREWPAALLAQSRIDPSIIPFRNGKPCPEVDGYLVSATGLARPNIQDACDIGNYVDALTVPAIVLPRSAARGVPTPFERLGAKVGDLVVVLRGGDSRPHFAVVGDSGPARSLGEVSVALAGDLLGRTAPPANYQEIRGRGRYRGQGWVVPLSFVLVLPGSRDSQDPYMSRARIESDAATRFEQWGGLERLRACEAVYRQR